MTDYEAYVMFQAFKRHFSNRTYDYIKYQGKVKTSVKAFNSRNDKIFYLKLSKIPDLENYMISNFLVNEKIWCRDLAYSSECQKIYEEYVKKIQSLSYSFGVELSKISEGSFKNLFKVVDTSLPDMVKFYIQKKISIETLCVLCDVTGIFEHWQNHISDADPVWNMVSFKIEKYMPFIKRHYTSEKMVEIIKDKFDL